MYLINYRYFKSTKFALESAEVAAMFLHQWRH